MSHLILTYVFCLLCLAQIIQSLNHFILLLSVLSALGRPSFAFFRPTHPFPISFLLVASDPQFILRTSGRQEICLLFSRHISRVGVSQEGQKEFLSLQILEEGAGRADVGVGGATSGTVGRLLDLMEAV